jgi:hypothetical protein
MFNQALFERLLILDDEVGDATAASWVRASRPGGPGPAGRIRGSKWTLEQGPRAASGIEDGAKTTMAPDSGAMVLNVDQVVRMRGLEPPRA